MGTYLFDRIVSPMGSPRLPLLEQIRQQVQRLVEGHRLAASANPLDILGLELGDRNTRTAVVDLGSQSSEDQDGYALQLEAIIRRYEPRIKHPRVIAIQAEYPSPVGKFLITGFIETDTEVEKFSFSTDSN